MMHKEEIKRNIKLNAVKSVKKDYKHFFGGSIACASTHVQKKSHEVREVRKKFDYMLIKVQFLPVLLYTKNGDFVHFPIIAMLGVFIIMMSRYFIH